MEPSHSPIGYHGHAGMAEEGASELKLRRIRRGLSYTVGQHQPLAPVTYSDPPPMSSSPRSGGDPDEEKGWSKSLKKDCVSEIVSEQEQSNPLLVAGEEVHASMAEEDAHELSLLHFGGPSHTVRPRLPSLVLPPSRPSSLPLSPLLPSSPLPVPRPGPRLNSRRGILTRLMALQMLPRMTDRAIAPSTVTQIYLLRRMIVRVSSDDEQSDPDYSDGEGSTSRLQGNGSHTVEIIASDMEGKILRESKKVLVQKEMIRRVPAEITYNLDEDAYYPRFVSFGPYHHGDLRSAYKYKWFFLEQILNMNKDVPLRQYLEEMDGMKQKVKGCYEQGIQMKNNDGIKMLLLDGCCILGFLAILPLPQQEVGAQAQTQDNLVAEASTVRKFISRVKKMLAPHPKQVALAVEAESKRTADSRIPLWHHDSIRHDLLLMENQLPFFVLEKIYGLATGTPDELKDKVDQTIQKLLAFYPLRTTDQSFHHLLHCCHLKFRPTKASSSSSNSKPTGELQPWRGATDLYKAGIKFKPKLRNHSESLLDVELVSGRTLMIPTLIIVDSTSSVFRNLIAFEQSCADENYFAAYAFFMKELMRTPADVTLLVKKGVVENHLGADKEVSDFFNSLTKRVAFDVHREHFLSSTFEELKNSYNSVGKKHIAELMQNYFRSPWLVISVVAAAIVLVCTVVQTVFAVIK